MDIDEVERRVKEKAGSGDPKQARERGGGEAVAKERRRGILRSVLVPVAACLATLAISIPVTILATRPHADIAGEGTADDPIAYLKGYSEYYYPYSIASLKDEKTVYGDVFYSYSSAKEQYLTIHFPAGVVSSAAIASESGAELCRGSSANLYFPFIGSTITFQATLSLVSGSSVTLDKTTLDVTPYYNWLESRK
jgi:hypothetical protein